MMYICAMLFGIITGIDRTIILNKLIGGMNGRLTTVRRTFMENQLQKLYHRLNNAFIKHYLKLTYDQEHHKLYVQPKTPHPVNYEIISKIKHDIDHDIYHDLYIISTFPRDNLFSIIITDRRGQTI